VTGECTDSKQSKAEQRQKGSRDAHISSLMSGYCLLITTALSKWQHSHELASGLLRANVNLPAIEQRNSGTG
jgi:hypothetical protein